MHNYCGNQKSNWTKFLPKGIGIAKYRMISRNLWNCEGGEKKPEKRRDDQCYSVHHAKRAQIDTFLGHIIIHYNEICVSNGDYTWNYACCVRTWTLIKCASSVLLSRYWILCFTLGLKVYYTFRLKNIKKGLLKPKRQSLTVKLVVVSGYNLIQYLFIGGEFWQIYHWITSSFYIFHALQNF